MLFNSLDFAIFFPVVFILYWFCCNHNKKVQNFLLLGASYFFYACWDWRFLFLLIFSTGLDYFTGIRIDSVSKAATKKIWLWISIGINLGFLGLFKYYNFFIQEFGEALRLLGFSVNFWTLKIILPVGISFYTFHGLSYVIDIYFGRIKADRNFIDYAVFVSFFPLLVAGPIERATHLLPQIKSDRFFNYTNAVDGLRQILWGLFKKMVIADNCAEYANIIFNDYSTQSGSTLIMGGVFFAFQIYGDFSGYSDIALGTARLLGIELLRNFAFPYFSRDIAEFWRRWHISLSSWFRDYLYIPLGGNSGGTWKRIRNTFVIFIVSGFWHGANWTFIAWGFLNAIYFLPILLAGNNRKNIDTVAQFSWRPSIKEVLSITFTFFQTVVAWVFFRSEDLSSAWGYLKIMFSTPFTDVTLQIPKTIYLLLFFFWIVEWNGRKQSYAIEVLGYKWGKMARYLFYSLLAFMILYFQGTQQEFIYFQF